MSATTNTVTANGKAAENEQIHIHTEDGSTWKNISPEFDAKMMEHLEKPFDADKIKVDGLLDDLVDQLLDPNRPIGSGLVPSNPILKNWSTFQEMRDMNNRPLEWNRRYLIRESNVDMSRKRMLDYEDGNKRRVVFNSKWHNGLHMVFDNRFQGKNKPSANRFGIRYPGGTNWVGEDWLLGMLAGTNDVVLGKNQLSSCWMFAAAGNDAHGHPQYAMFTRTSGATEIGGIWFPEDGIARAGYDKDWEWRTYADNDNPTNGYFKVKFERFDYNEGPR